MDGLLGAPGGSGTVAKEGWSRGNNGRVLGLVTTETDEGQEAEAGIRRVDTFTNGIKGAKTSKNNESGIGIHRMGNVSGKIGIPRGVVVASGSSAAISRGAIRSRQKN